MLTYNIRFGALIVCGVDRLSEIKEDIVKLFYMQNKTLTTENNLKSNKIFYANLGISTVETLIHMNAYEHNLNDALNFQLFLTLLT